eukprot:scaffold69097_cov30-Prasinocladus_malaysianus.AAC.3
MAEVGVTARPQGPASETPKDYRKLSRATGPLRNPYSCSRSYGVISRSAHLLSRATMGTYYVPYEYARGDVCSALHLNY